ncbi:GM12541 [Drosophila sechellia]|uniref:GM12541 n=1 Tax=Drosophila sechellia TaxID=7238 RepID=B4I037_DROSE|nr:GM12541 [Drosophila sechellia]
MADPEDYDLNFVQLSRQQTLQRYAGAVRQLRRLADQRYGVRSLSFDNYVLFQYFRQRNWQTGVTPPAPLMAYLKLEVLHHLLDRRRQILCWLFYLTLVSLCVAAYRYEVTSSTGGHQERVIQAMVYPGMRMWRRMTMPLIQRFPQLTELYDESADGQSLEDLSCGPCAEVEIVWLEGEECANGHPLKYHQNHKCHQREGSPIAFRSNQQEAIDLSQFYNIYASNHEIFQRDAYRVHSTNQDVHNLEDLFGQFNSSWTQQAHNLWRCNRMLPARLLRPIFARPTRLPSMGVALERYVAIDTAQAPAYTLPETECPNVYVHQAVGTRFIILRPTSECRHRCRTLSLRLTQSFVREYRFDCLCSGA